MLARGTVRAACRAISTLLLATCCAATALAAPPAKDAAAERDALEASELWKAGYALFQKKRFSEALVKFRGADRLLPDKAEILYYLGRTHAALDQCEDALAVLTPLAGKLGDSEAALEAERIRAAEEAGCRVSIGEKRFAAFACLDAVEVLATLSPAALPADARPAAKVLSAEASRCAAEFATGDPKGRAAARAHAEAGKHLAEGRPADALRLADESLAHQVSGAGKLMRALALEQLTRCQEALTALDGVQRFTGSVRQAQQAGVIDRCRLVEARRFVAAEDCRSAAPLLELLQGRVIGTNQTWLDDSRAWCDARTTAFVTDTAPRRRAHALFLAARRAAESGNAADAAGRYREALSLADEPIIRHELANALLVNTDCAGIEDAISGIPIAARTPRDDAALRACGAWRPARRLEGRGFVGYVDALEQANRKLDANEFEAARKLLEAMFMVGANPALRAASLDVLYQMGRCTQYLAETNDAPQAVREKLAASDARWAHCAAQTGAAVSAAPAAPADDSAFGLQSAQVSPKPARRGARIVGWIGLSLGVASVGAAAFSMVRRKSAIDRATDAAGTYNGDSTSAPDALSASEDYKTAVADARTWRTRTIAFGAAGGAAVLTGIILIVVGRKPTSQRTATVEPYMSNRSLGLAGSF